MYLGKIVEMGPAEEVIRHPLHPYTQALLEAVPVPDPEISRKKRMPKLRSLDIPSPINPPPGCKFHTRCPYYMEKCTREEPPLIEVRPNHYVACWLYAKR
jgi:oligopeptide/dipeptide ABC transporter ATP-binding protein